MSPQAPTPKVAIFVGRSANLLSCYLQNLLVDLPSLLIGKEGRLRLQAIPPLVHKNVTILNTFLIFPSGLHRRGRRRKRRGGAGRWWRRGRPPLSTPWRTPGSSRYTFVKEMYRYGGRKIRKTPIRNLRNGFVVINQKGASMFQT